MVKRLTTLTLCLLLLLCPTNCFANDIDTPIDDGVIDEYVNIRTYSSSVSISGLIANCTASLKSKSSMNLSITMSLQKKSSGAYSTVKTWSKSKTGTSLAISESYVINPLNDYRIKVVFNAGGEATTVYSYP